MQITIFIIISMILTSCVNSQYYYIESGKFHKYEVNHFKENEPDSVKLLLNGHHIEKGNYLVLLIRKFDPGSYFAVDDETYEKLTIMIKKFKIDEPCHIDSSSVDIYYSRGSSGFLRKAHGVFAENGMGTITIRKIKSETIIADLNFNTIAYPAGSFPFEKQQIKIQGHYTFKKINIEELTPWLGSPGHNIGNEVYP